MFTNMRGGIHLIALRRGMPTYHPPRGCYATRWPMTPSPSSPRPLALADLLASASTEVSWLWHGYLARGGVTLLTSQWKAGKTTLLSVLLARLETGGPGRHRRQ